MKRNNFSSVINELDPENVNTTLTKAQALFEYCNLKTKDIVRKSGISARQINIYTKKPDKLQRAQYLYVLRLADLFEVEYAKQVGGDQIEEGCLFQKLVDRTENKLLESMLAKYMHYEEDPNYADVFSSIINKILLTRYTSVSQISHDDYRLAVFYHECVQAGLPIGKAKPQLKDCDILAVDRKAYSKVQEEVSPLLDKALNKMMRQFKTDEKLTEQQIKNRINFNKQTYQIDENTRLTWNPIINEYFLKLFNENDEKIPMNSNNDMSIGLGVTVETKSKNKDHYCEVMKDFITVHDRLRKFYANNFWRKLGRLCGYWL